MREEDNDAFWDDIMVGIKELLTAKDRGELAQLAFKQYGNDDLTDLSPEEMLDNTIRWTFDRYRVSICECEQCGRIYIQKAPGINEYVGYTPEDGAAHHILHSAHDIKRESRLKQARSECQRRYGGMLQRFADGDTQES